MSEYIKFRGAVYILAKHMDIKVVRASWSRLVRFIQSTVPEIWKTAELLARHKSQFLSDLALLDTWDATTIRRFPHDSMINYLAAR